jgi:hypothetical protein
VDIHLNELGARREESWTTQSQAVVDPLAKHQEQVRFLERRGDSLIERRISVSHA